MRRHSYFEDFRNGVGQVVSFSLAGILRWPSRFGGREIPPHTHTPTPYAQRGHDVAEFGLVVFEENAHCKEENLHCVKGHLVYNIGGPITVVIKVDRLGGPKYLID